MKMPDHSDKPVEGSILRNAMKSANFFNERPALNFRNLLCHKRQCCRKLSIAAFLAIFVLILLPTNMLYAQTGKEHGEIAFRVVGVITAIAALLLILYQKRKLKKNVSILAFYVTSCTSFIILPTFAILSANAIFLEEPKLVSSCDSCHIMNPYVTDMTNPASSTLAAQHYKYKWIAKDQCYACHAGPGFKGSLDAKTRWFKRLAALYDQQLGRANYI